MKHPLSITALLVLLFFVAQVVGVSLLSLDIKAIETKDGTTTVAHNPVAVGARPETQGAQSFLYLALGVAIGTALVLLLIKLKAFNIWKIWFLLAIWVSTSIAFGVILPAAIAMVLCFLLAVWKVYWPNPIVHNLTEIFMYAGLAILLVPIFTIFWMAVLLAVVSIYDIIAVWYSKHMIVMAKAQTESNLFAGLYIPKSKEIPAPKSPKLTLIQAPTKKTSSAILGGGDIAFPLIFSGVAMEWLITQGQSRIGALYETLIITACATIALALLFYFAKKEKFYPAMPFLSVGCFVGLAIIILL